MKWRYVPVLLLSVLPARAQTPPSASDACASCAAWNAPQKPFRIYGNSYYVGTHELSAILITSPQGDVLIDGDLAQSAPQIADHIRALGFRVQDVRLILNSHVHHDHAGGIAALQKLSRAQVAASPSGAAVLRAGGVGQDDPQYGTAPPIDRVPQVRTIRDGETLRVGPLALTAHFTPGHTPGGTSWSWKSCEGDKCRNIVYADSLTAVSADKYRFTDHADLLSGFQKSFATLDALPCDILLTPHPGFSNILKRLDARENGGKANAFLDANACSSYAASSRQGLAKRLAQEKAELKK